MEKFGSYWYSMGNPPTLVENQNVTRRVLVVAMVGLPGRGKTSTAYKLQRYLCWVGHDSKVFLVSDPIAMETYDKTDLKKIAASILEETAKTLDTIGEWLETGDKIAVLDCENITAECRNLVYNIVVNKMGYNLFFIELICDDTSVIKKNIAESVGLMSTEPHPDFVKKINQLIKLYEPIDVDREPHLSFMKMQNLGQKFQIHNRSGRSQGRVIYFVINTQVISHVIYLTRHGESALNVQHRIGGNSSLSKQGRAYAVALANYIKFEVNLKGLRVWTSWMKRTIETAEHIKLPQTRWKALNEINAGVFEGFTYKEIETQYPAEFLARQNDKLNYRYPGGESYKDVKERLEPIIIEMERQGNILVISHQSIMRCLFSFFLGTPSDIMPVLKVPLHTIFKFTLVPSGIKVERNTLPIEAVDTDYDPNESIEVKDTEIKI